MPKAALAFLLPFFLAPCAQASEDASLAACESAYSKIALETQNAAASLGLAPALWPRPAAKTSAEWPRPEFAAFSLVPLGEIWLSPFACALPENEALILWSHELGHAIAHAQRPELAEDAFPGARGIAGRAALLAIQSAGRIPAEEHERAADLIAGRIVFRLSPKAAMLAVETFALSCARQAAKSAAGAPGPGASAKESAFAPVPAEACNKTQSWSAAIRLARQSAEERFLAEEAETESPARPAGARK